MQLRHLRTFLIRTESYRDRIYIREVATQQPMLLLIYNTRFIRRKQKHTQEGPPGVVASSGGPCRVVRRRATLPHPVGCSTIAVPGLSFRVRNGTGRLSWAMAAANLGLSAGKRGFPPACGGSGTGQWTRCVLLLTDRARVRTCSLCAFAGPCRVLRHTPSRACGCGLPLDH